MKLYVGMIVVWCVLLSSVASACCAAVSWDDIMQGDDMVFVGTRLPGGTQGDCGYSSTPGAMADVAYTDAPVQIEKMLHGGFASDTVMVRNKLLCGMSIGGPMSTVGETYVYVVSVDDGIYTYNECASRPLSELQGYGYGVTWRSWAKICASFLCMMIALYFIIKSIKEARKK